MRGHERHILVVDDETNMRTTLAAILEDEGYVVSQAANGEVAVKMCARRFYDLVLMDIRMPGIDGVEAFRRIRKQRTDTRVVMMSAYSVEELERSVLRFGAVAFMRKPLDAKRLLAVIGTETATGRVE